MIKVCDHTSVGMFVWRGEKLLLIERSKFPKGFAVPAGHVDEDRNYEDSARRELREEVGLEVKNLKLIAEGKRENPCRRKGGTWHYWKLYQVEVSGNVIPNKDETKKVDWYTKDEIKVLAKKTESYNKGNISESDWNKSPGLEPIMYEWFKKLKII